MLFFVSDLLTAAHLFHSIMFRTHLSFHCHVPSTSITSFHPISSNKDCKRYKNSKAIKCYNCDSCKAGVAQYIKTEWRVIAIFNVILFVVLSMVYFVGCCARRHAARMHSKS